MTSSPDETYVQTYQKYLKQKDNSDDLRKAISSHTASIKVIKTVLKNKECKICKVLAKPEDLSKVLNQGLYHKYTSSQDYFYTRDINSLLLKKRNDFTVRYNDDLIYDESRERLKGYFKRKETASIMNEIKQFYSQFKNFPRNFQTQFFRIINSNIRKHRRLEYIRVFNGVNLDDDKPQSEDSNQSSASRPEKDNGEFVFMEMLGSSFLQENYRDHSGVVVGGLKLDKRRDTEQSLMDLDSNFKAIYKVPKNAINDPASVPFSNALYNNNYMLYSRNDSETAEDILKQIVQEFREVDLSRKASISLAEKVLNRVNATPKNVTRQENRCSPTLKPRVSGGLELSPTITASKKSLGSNNVNIAVSLAKQQANPLSTSQRVSSNPRNNSRVETENTSKLSQSKVLEQRKSNAKFPTEHLNDLSIERNKILSSVYQFRSTRSKSGGLKTMNTTSKTPTAGKMKRPLAINCDMSQGADSSEPKLMQTAYYINKKSPSPSPERKFESNILQPKDSKINALKRSTSQGRHLGIKEALSPSNIQAVSSAHSKTGSVVKRATATPKKQKPAVMVQNLMTSNTSGSTNNVSNSLTQENPGTPNNMKFINPLKAALGNPQPFYFRHQSPIDERMTPVSLGLHPVKSEAKFKNLNMRSVKNASPKRTDSNSRVNTLSISGRNQNMLDISQGLGSSACTQSSFHANKTTTTGNTATKRKKVGKAEMQILGPKIISKRDTGTPGTGTLNQTTSPSEDTMIKDKKSKKHLELSDTNFLSYKDLRLSTSKDQTPSNIGPSSTTSLSKYKVDMKKNGFSSYTLKGSTKDLRLSLKK